jgi:hypothetical protein
MEGRVDTAFFFETHFQGERMRITDGSYGSNQTG